MSTGTDGAPLKLSFANRIEAIPVVRQRVEAYLLGNGCQQRVAEEFVLAIDELCNNAVQHGPEGSERRLTLLVVVDQKGTRCRLTAPNEMPVEELRKMTEQAELPDFDSERGRGLFLIRMMVDGFNIREREAGLIDLEMEKRF